MIPANQRDLESLDCWSFLFWPATATGSLGIAACPRADLTTAGMCSICSCRNKSGCFPLILRRLLCLSEQTPSNHLRFCSDINNLDIRMSCSKSSERCGDCGDTETLWATDLISCPTHSLSNYSGRQAPGAYCLATTTTTDT